MIDLRSLAKLEPEELAAWDYLLPDDFDDPELPGDLGLVAAVVYQALRDAVQGYHPTLQLASCCWLLTFAPRLVEPFGIEPSYFAACVRAVLPDELIEEAESLPPYLESALLAWFGDDEALDTIEGLLNG